MPWWIDYLYKNLSFREELASLLSLLTFMSGCHLIFYYSAVWVNHFTSACHRLKMEHVDRVFGELHSWETFHWMAEPLDFSKYLWIQFCSSLSHFLLLLWFPSYLCSHDAVCPLKPWAKISPLSLKFHVFSYLITALRKVTETVLGLCKITIN